MGDAKQTVLMCFADYECCTRPNVYMDRVIIVVFAEEMRELLLVRPDIYSIETINGVNIAAQGPNLIIEITFTGFVDEKIKAKLRPINGAIYIHN